MALFALRDIEPGEELTYDYNFSLFNPAVGQVSFEKLLSHILNDVSVLSPVRIHF